jgi:hypothetical protein
VAFKITQHKNTSTDGMLLVSWTIATCCSGSRGRDTVTSEILQGRLLATSGIDFLLKAWFLLLLPTRPTGWPAEVQATTVAIASDLPDFLAVIKRNQKLGNNFLLRNFNQYTFFLTCSSRPWSAWIWSHVGITRKNLIDNLFGATSSWLWIVFFCLENQKCLWEAENRYNNISFAFITLGGAFITLSELV